MIKSNLSDFPLLSSLSDSEKAAILTSSIEHEFKAKEIIIEQGANTHSVYFIIQGTVRVYRISDNGDEITLSILDKGNILGEMAFIDHEPRSAFVEAMKDAIILELPAYKFMEILQKYPKMAMHLLVELSKKVRNSDQYLEDILTKNLHSRTLNALKTLAHYFPNKEIVLTHEELASIIGATRSRVTEALNELEKENKIINQHKKILVLL